MRTWLLEGGGGGGGGGGVYVITTFIKRIQFCILTGKDKENSSHIYQTSAQTIISNQSCVLVILMQEIFPKEKGT